MLVKICGLTRVEDAMAAAAAGAGALGFVFAPSPRRVTVVEARAMGAALPADVLRVGVFVSPSPATVENMMAAAALDLVQIHGDFPPAAWARLGTLAIRAVRVGMDPPSRILVAGDSRYLLLDTFRPGTAGGTGVPFPWTMAAAYRRLGLPILLAGGLTPDKIQSALDAVNPAGVDVSTGVESAPGRKDPALMRALIQAVRAWESMNRPGAAVIRP